MGDQLPIVSYSITRTINLGNYESVRVQAGLTLTAADQTQAAVEKAYRKVKKFVDDRIEEEESKWKNQ